MHVLHVCLCLRLILQVIISTDKAMRHIKTSAKDYRPRCQHPGCTTQASFGHKHDKKLVSCAKHQADGMVSLTRTAAFGLPHTKVS
jgi:hypothetical protein